MNSIWTITKRELRSFFNSLMAYVMIVLFLGFSGFFTWLYGSDVFFIKQASLQTFFNIAYWTLFFFIPALTMRLIAEEKHSGTIELLFTKPLSDWHILFAKFLATLILIAIALGLTFPYVITIAKLGNLDQGAVITGYLGLLLMSGAYISIGLFASSINNNQIVAFLVTLFIGIFFHILFGALASNFSGVTGKILYYLSLENHYESITRGVIDLTDLVYFLSIMAIGLFASEAVLSKRNLTEA